MAELRLPLAHGLLPSAKAVRTSPAVRPAASVPRLAARAATSGGV